jgi:putrescine aminotransferase
MKDKGLLSVEEALSLSRVEIRELHQRHLNQPLANEMALLDYDRRFVRASGAELWDENGARYLDLLSGYGALNLGHNHPRVVAAVSLMADRNHPSLIPASLGALSAALAHNLFQILPEGLTRAFFCNSGAEAVEGALKMARAATGRQKIIYCENSFHGKTFGALSVTGREKYRKPFEPLLPGCEAVPFGDASALESKLRRHDVAAFIIEPIQGEGGVIIPPDGYLSKARELCSRNHALLIADEVQTGFGRTGRMFACEHENVIPDVICLAKSLGGGIMPIGAYVAAEKVYRSAYGSMSKCLLHTSTFSGNPWACAAAIAAINAIVAEDLPSQAEKKGAHFLPKLQALAGNHPLIGEVRGKGLMVGVEFARPSGVGAIFRGLAREYLASMIAAELLTKHNILTAYTLNNPNVIRLQPPLIITTEQLDEVVAALDETLIRCKSLLGATVSTAKTVIGRIFSRRDESPPQ